VTVALVHDLLDSPSKDVEAGFPLVDFADLPGEPVNQDADVGQLAAHYQCHFLRPAKAECGDQDPAAAADDLLDRADEVPDLTGAITAVGAVAVS
jgi:hypothetical protein